MKFSYTALSSDNQKLTGVLEANNLEGAQGELHKMGVSIISIKEISDAGYDEIQKKEVSAKKISGVITYSFLAVDKGGKEINGTIDARDPYSAYKRLVIEYGFKINELYPSTATDAEKANSKKKIAGFAANIKSEGVDVDAKRHGSNDDLLEASEKIDKKIIQEIDQFIIKTKKVLTEHKEKFSPPFLRQIESTLGELERIRTSNNIKHITEICNQIYELISNPDQISQSPEKQGETSYQQIIDSLQSTGIVKRQFNIHSKAVGLSKIKSLFNKVFSKFKSASESELVLPGDVQGEESGFKKFLNSITNKFKSKNRVPLDIIEASESVKTPSIIGIFFSYIFSPNAMLRKARKQELKNVFNDWKSSKNKKKEISESAEGKSEVRKAGATPSDDKIAEKTTEQIAEDEEAKTGPAKWKASALFSEVDSFISWLLFFYIIYFFLISFSLEKNIGVPREFVAKTLKTPLILDITIFLLVIHLLFKIRDSLFRQNILGTTFLFLFGLGFYSLIVLNF